MTALLLGAAFDVVGLSILVGGGLACLLLGLFAVKAVTKLALSAPENEARLSAIEARLPALEQTAVQALDVAEKARKQTARREARAAREKRQQAESDPGDGAVPRAGPVANGDIFARHRALFLSQGGKPAKPAPSQEELSVTDVQLD